MTSLSIGANAGLSVLPATVTVRPASPLPAGIDLDVTLYLLGSDGKVVNDEGMVFYGMEATPDGNVTKIAGPADFRIAALPAGIDRIAITAVADDTAGTARGLDGAGRLILTVTGGDGAAIVFEHDVSRATEKAIILGEVYVRNGQTKVRAVGQGFDGGLKPLSESFGVKIADDDAAAPAPAPAPTPANKVDLRKQRLVSLEKEHPKLVSLAKQAGVSLKKRGLENDRAKVCLVLDVSGSIHGLFTSGSMQTLVERALAYGLNLDDDGQIDVCLFDTQARMYGTVDATNYKDFTPSVLRMRGIWGGTDYASAIREIRSYYEQQADHGKLPVYVMFVTDGGTGDRNSAERELRDISGHGFFFKFMAIGPKPRGGFFGRALPAGFDFLAYLDDMPGRVVDNADFFSVEDPAAVSDADMFENMSEEYPKWLQEVRARGIVGA